MTSAGRADAAATRRAGSRLLLAMAGALTVGLVAVPAAVVVRSAWPPLVDADDAVTGAAEDAVRGSGALLGLARATTLLGDPGLVWLVVAVLAAVLALRGHHRLALFLLAVRAGTQLLSTTLKAAVDRARPAFDVPVDTAFGGSFPSGHTLAGTGLWVSLAVLALPLVRPSRRAAVLLAGVLVAALVAASRVLLGVHYLSDVVGGLLLGLGWTAVCAALLVRWQADSGVPVDRVSDAVADR